MANAVMRIATSGTRKIPKRVAFTGAVLDVAACPAGKDRIWIYDAKQPGLGMMITSGGAKSFYAYFKFQGRPQRLRLGGFPEISIEQARTLAKKALIKKADGIDPMKERREARAKGMNLGDLWKWFLDSWAKPRKRSWMADKSRYDTHLKTWENKRLTDITRADVAALHKRVSQAASMTTANRVLVLLSTMFTKAKMIGWDKDNPCKGVEKYAEESRERFLSGEELKRFFVALEEMTDTNWKHFLKLCLFTGGRRGNVLSMRWDELTLSSCQWAIPAKKFKNGKPAVVHLPVQALEILEARKGNKSDWVFPSYGKSGHLGNPAKPWATLTASAKLADVRIHDLRRTLGSWQAANGSSLAIIGKSLGHRSQAATAVYARLDLDPIAVSVDAATAAMVAAGRAEDKPAATE